MAEIYIRVRDQDSIRPHCHDGYNDYNAWTFIWVSTKDEQATAKLVLESLHTVVLDFHPPNMFLLVTYAPGSIFDLGCERLPIQPVVERLHLQDAYLVRDIQFWCDEILAKRPGLGQMFLNHYETNSPAISWALLEKDISSVCNSLKINSKAYCVYRMVVLGYSVC